MSALPVEHTDESPDRPFRDGDDHTVVAGRPVVVRRHAGIAALVSATASAVAIAYLWRASQSLAVLDWALFGVMAVVAAFHLATLVDSRTPLLVADDLGVRIRLGSEWRGLPWDAIAHVQVHPRRGVLRDGRLVFTPRSLARALDGVEHKGRRLVRLNQRLYGAPLAVPVGLTTRVTVGSERPTALADEIAALALGRADVVEVAPVVREEPARAATPVEADPGEDAAVAETAWHDAVEHDPAGHEEATAATATATATPAEADAPGEIAADSDDHDQDHDHDHDDHDFHDLHDLLVEVPTDAAVADAEALAEEQHHADGFSDGRRRTLGGLGTIISRVAKGRRHDVDDAGPARTLDTDTDAESAPAQDDTASAGDDDRGEDQPTLGAVRSAVPLRTTRPGSRAEVTRDYVDPVPPAESTAVARPLQRPGSVDLVYETESAHVRPIAVPGDPVEPLVIGDFVTEPAFDPVIGPEVTAARTRLGLSVDELADRTRIRPHVIESIEVDDFAPCGGDFYARGHLRTLARFLGKDPVPMLAEFESRYATAPINARRVFEAELATGMTGSMRSTVGGPRWGMLIGMVLALVLVWAVVRLFAAEPAQIIDTTAPVLTGSTGLDPAVPVAPGSAGDVAAPPVVAPTTLVLTATQADTRISIRDGNGVVVYRGPIVLGERRTVQAVPPVRVRAGAGGVVEVSVNGRDRGLLGDLAPAGAPREPAVRTFRTPR